MRRWHAARTRFVAQATRWVTLALLVLPTAALGQLTDDPLDEEESFYRFGFEIKGHLRDSESARFPSPFPFQPSSIPAGQDQVFLETVEDGNHVELSVVTLWFEARWKPWLTAKLKVDLVDRYDRNPTSEDNEFDVDEAWLRFGTETEPGELPDKGWGAYLKLGKIPKFERQDDRHLESYGVVATAFNRAEDVGFEGGVDFGRRLYLKTSFTSGNPLFFRDPNALAGDNGTSNLRQPNPVLEFETGFPIFYDADVEDYDFQHMETGVGLGLRLGDENGRIGADVLAWVFNRELADTVDFTGSFYGGDLDILRGPLNLFPLPIKTEEKTEWGANVWLYAGGFTFFGQIVEQDLAGLPRDGQEVEVSYTFDLPYTVGFAGRQLFSYIQPAIRYSRLDPQFSSENPFPAPSVFWDWEKIDAGLRVGLLENTVDLTVEWNDNTFVRAGRDESADEFLATIRWEMDWTRTR
ncbi:MAG: hypothetical protein AAF657_16780 [Acidobacteriota bacterium]